MKNNAGLIVFDGMDGAGKGVQSNRVLEAFNNIKRNVILTREPGGSTGAEEIRRLLVEGDPEKWDSIAELLLMYAARRSHLRDTIWPALERGCWVISDRYADSSRAFQGIAGNLGLESVERIHQFTVGDFEPDLTIILDVAPEISLARAEARGGKEDRFERKGLEYHTKVREAFRTIAHRDPLRHVLIDGAQTMDQVTTEVLSVLNERFALDLGFTVSTENT